MDGCIVVQVHLQWNKVKCNNTVFCIILEAYRIWPPDAVQEFTLILNKHYICEIHFQLKLAERTKDSSI